MTIKRLLTSTLALLLIGLVLFQPTIEAITPQALRAINRNTADYGPEEEVEACTPSGGGALSGTDNEQKTYNFFRGKGLTEIQAAAIVGNLKLESGINPTINQGGGGPGRGIAQWEAGARWDVLLRFAEPYGNKEGIQSDLSEAEKALEPQFWLKTQLEFMWSELNNDDTLINVGDYTDAFNRFKEATSTTPPSGFSEIAVATGYFMGTAAARDGGQDELSKRFIAQFGKIGGYENPGILHLERRVQYAQAAVDSFAGGGVSGTNAGCGGGAINCPTNGTAASAGIREKVVCLAEAEYALWESGEMGPGGDYEKYTFGANAEWCGYFISYIYNQAGYPINPNAQNGVEAAVDNVKTIGKSGSLFTWHPKGEGYIPKPGDIALYQNGWSHVNIVISVNANEGTMVTIGGNEGNIRNNAQSLVTRVDRQIEPSQLTGFVSPKE